MMDMTLNQWCNECEALRESMSKLKSAFAQQMNIICGLKEKIIPTDQLIIDVYTKQEENQALARNLEISKRLCEDLGQQLRSTLAQLEPLREAKDKLGRHVQRCEKDIERLKADVDAYKISQEQLKAAHDSVHEKLKKSEEEKREALNSFRKTESRLKRCQDELASRKNDVSELKKENIALHNEIKELKLELELTNCNENSTTLSCGSHVEPNWSSSQLVPIVTFQSGAYRVNGTADFDITQLFESDLLRPLPPLISPLVSPASTELKLSDEGSCCSEDGDDDDASIDHYASLQGSEFRLFKDIDAIQPNTLKDEILCEHSCKGYCENTVSKDEKLDSGQVMSQLSTGFIVSCDTDLVSNPDLLDISVASLSPIISSQHLNTLAVGSPLLKLDKVAHSMYSIPYLSPSIDTVINSQCLHFEKTCAVETTEVLQNFNCCESCVSIDSVSLLCASSSTSNCGVSHPGSSFISLPSYGFECSYQNTQPSFASPLSIRSHKSLSVGSIATTASDVPLSISDSNSFRSTASSYGSCASLCPAVHPTNMPGNIFPSLMLGKTLICNTSGGVALNSVVNVLSVINRPICSPSATVLVSSNALTTGSFIPSSLFDVTATAPSSCVTCTTSCLSSICCNSSSGGDGSTFEIASHSSDASDCLSSLEHKVFSAVRDLNELPSSSASIGIKSSIKNISLSTASIAPPMNSCTENQCSTTSCWCDDPATSVDLLPSGTNDTISDYVPLNAEIIDTTLNGVSSILSSEQFSKVSPSVSISTMTSYILPQSLSAESTTSLSILPALPFVTTMFTSTYLSVCNSNTTSDSLLGSLSLSSGLLSMSKSCGDGELDSLAVAKSPIDLDYISISALETKPYANGDHGSAQQVSMSIEEIFEVIKIPSPLPPLSPVSFKCDAGQTDSFKSMSSKQLASNMPLLPVKSDFKPITEGRRTRRKSYPPDSVSIAGDQNADSNSCSVLESCSGLTPNMNCLPTVSAVQVKSKSPKRKRVIRKSSVLLGSKIDASIIKSAVSNSSNVGITRGEKRKASESNKFPADIKVCRSLRSNTKIEPACKKDISIEVKGSYRNFTSGGSSVIQSKANATPKAILTDAALTLSPSDESVDVAFLIKKCLQLNEDLVSMWYNRCRTGLTSDTKQLTTRSQENVVVECCKLSDTLIKEFSNQAVQILGRKNEDAMMNGNMALCCVFVSLCRLKGDSECVRMFVYDAIRKQYCGYCSLILCVAAVWPLPLQQNEPSDIAFPLLDVLQYVICVKALSASTCKKQKMQFCFEKLCGWKLVTETADEIAQRILNQLEEHIQQTTAPSEAFATSIKMSFNLLSVVEGWKWSNNFIVIQLLWPVLSSWAADSETKKQTFVEAVIGILGFVMCNCPATCKNNTDQIIDVFLALLQEPSVAVSIQLSVLQSLLMLTKFQPDRCATMCIQWVEGHRRHLDPKTKQLLQDYYKRFSPTLKYLSRELVNV